MIVKTPAKQQMLTTPRPPWFEHVATAQHTGSIHSRQSGRYVHPGPNETMCPHSGSNAPHSEDVPTPPPPLRHPLGYLPIQPTYVTLAQQWVERKSRLREKQNFPPPTQKETRPDNKPGQNCTQPHPKTQHTTAASSLSLSFCSKSISGALTPNPHPPDLLLFSVCPPCYSPRFFIFSAISR